MKGGFPYHIYAFWESLDASLLGQGVISVWTVSSVFFKGTFPVYLAAGQKPVVGFATCK